MGGRGGGGGGVGGGVGMGWRMEGKLRRLRLGRRGQRRGPGGRFDKVNFGAWGYLG